MHVSRPRVGGSTDLNAETWKVAQLIDVQQKRVWDSVLMLVAATLAVLLSLYCTAGAIPRELANLRSMQDLDLRSNLLEGGRRVLG